jgi:hypothetical protein
VIFAMVVLVVASSVQGVEWCHISMSHTLQYYIVGNSIAARTINHDHTAQSSNSHAYHREASACWCAVSQHTDHVKAPG